MIGDVKNVEEDKYIRSTFKGYLMFVVLKVNLRPNGVTAVLSHSDTIASVSVQIDQGDLLVPIADKALSPEINRLAGAIRTYFRKSLGLMGESLEVVIFPDPATSSKTGALSEGLIKMRFAGDKFDWRLPLGSFLPVKVDSKTGEEFPGNFIFNPFTGNSLDRK